MASTNRSAFESVLAATRQAVEFVWIPLTRVIEPIWERVAPAFRFVTSSVFRFLIAFGIVLLAIGAAIGEGTAAGHLLIYGATAIFLGILGRGIVHWKLKNSV
ncbi:hypothetical protein [Natronoglomus mannanivorans]|uniref:Uncharacterized protein n=1 Tax=Natronoglomus mannanivorans TaxID=2979990 RepID=A0AAP2Z1T6_9EURY|nr:hypothetical protein [Halobacteria archaeon AArc-xg1-1]